MRWIVNSSLCPCSDLTAECDCQLKQMRTLPPLSSERGRSYINCLLGRRLLRGRVQTVSMIGGQWWLRTGPAQKESPPATLLMAPQDGMLQGLSCEDHAASGNNCMSKSRMHRRSFLAWAQIPSSTVTSKIEYQSNTKLTLVIIGKQMLSGSLTFRKITQLYFSEWLQVFSGNNVFSWWLILNQPLSQASNSLDIK